MGLFGLFYGLFAGTACVISDIRDTCRDCDQKAQAILNKQDWYLDTKGRQRLVSDGRICYGTNDVKTGDRILVDLHNNVIRNYSQERRDARRLEAIKNNKTVYLVSEPHEPRPWKYKDLKTGELYTIETSGFPRFYEDKNGFEIRIIDEDIDGYERLPQCRKDAVMRVWEIHNKIIAKKLEEKNAGVML